MRAGADRQHPMTPRPAAARLHQTEAEFTAAQLERDGSDRATVRYQVARSELVNAERVGRAVLAKTGPENRLARVCGESVFAACRDRAGRRRVSVLRREELNRRRINGLVRGSAPDFRRSSLSMTSGAALWQPRAAMPLNIGENLETLKALQSPLIPHDGSVDSFGRYRCARCVADRLMDMIWYGGIRTVAVGRSPLVPTTHVVRRSPGAAELVCRDCAARHVVLFSWSDDALRVLSADVVALRTQRTPKAVGHYLDEVARCRAIGARSAAAAMGRSALEHLLFDQGFAGMLGQQIKTLLEKKEAGAAPPWAQPMDLAYVTALKELGNGAIHANGGNIDLQAAIDDQMLNDLEAVLEYLLEEVYERPAREQERRDRLNSSAKVFKAVK